MYWFDTQQQISIFSGKKPSLFYQKLRLKTNVLLGFRRIKN